MRLLGLVLRLGGVRLLLRLARTERMTSTVASMVMLAGAVMAVSGIFVQRRALARYAKQPRPRGVHGYWNCTELFEDKRGIRLYLQGDALLSWGMMVVLSTTSYLAGLND